MNFKHSAFIENTPETRMIGEAVEHGANFILSKWQEAERWRSVEEELPEYEL